MQLKFIILVEKLIEHLYEQNNLTLKAPITISLDNIHKFFFHCFSEKLRLDVSSEFSAWQISDVLSESSARQRIHMKNQALFSSENKSKKLKCHLLQFLFGALRVNIQMEVTSND